MKKRERAHEHHGNQRPVIYFQHLWFWILCESLSLFPLGFVYRKQIMISFGLYACVSLSLPVWFSLTEYCFHCCRLCLTISTALPFGMHSLHSVGDIPENCKTCLHLRGLCYNIQNLITQWAQLYACICVCVRSTSPFKHNADKKKNK